VIKAKCSFRNSLCVINADVAEMMSEYAILRKVAASGRGYRRAKPLETSTERFLLDNIEKLKESVQETSSWLPSVVNPVGKWRRALISFANKLEVSIDDLSKKFSTREFQSFAHLHASDFFFRSPSNSPLTSLHVEIGAVLKSIGFEGNGASTFFRAAKEQEAYEEGTARIQLLVHDSLTHVSGVANNCYIVRNTERMKEKTTHAALSLGVEAAATSSSSGGCDDYYEDSRRALIQELHHLLGRREGYFDDWNLLELRQRREAALDALYETKRKNYYNGSRNYKRQEKTIAQTPQSDDNASQDYWSPMEQDHYSEDEHQYPLSVQSGASSGDGAVGEKDGALVAHPAERVIWTAKDKESLRLAALHFSKSWVGIARSSAFTFSPGIQDLNLKTRANKLKSYFSSPAFQQYLALQEGKQSV